jgi:hypothetical protein
MMFTGADTVQMADSIGMMNDQWTEYDHKPISVFA